MINILVKLGSYIYYATPVSWLKRFYTKVFYRLVRGKIICTSIEGIAYELDLGEIIDVSIYLQNFERDVASAIEKYCCPGWKVLDIGANIGAHTFRLAKKVGPEGRVFAFEPTDFAFAKLTRNISLNDFNNIFPFKIALSDINLKNQQVHFRASWLTNGGRADGLSVVDFERLDDWSIGNHIININFIKIDVDGNEFSILQGGIKIIEKCKPVLLMEVVWPHFDNEDRNPFKILKDLGYSFWDTRSGEEYVSLEAMKILLPANDMEMTQGFNVIAAVDLPGL
ncbi:MAG: FkbM family methyltransferase [Deltaproteobacteria bacterium]|nr:FkbM family methyltransferase [Candidatus Poribacteria bacterium]MBM4300102.1 FkbM family methyltransferase [Deltaproteobacteria bacterium]